jgi:hypothetical protein
MIDAPTIMTSVGSTLAGGVTVGWIAKTLITNYLKRNDQQHERWRKSINDLKDIIDKQQTSIAVINTKLDYLGNIKEEVDGLKQILVKHKSVYISNK